MVSDENCEKGLKNQYKMSLPTAEFNCDIKIRLATVMDGANLAPFYYGSRIHLCG